MALKHLVALFLITATPAAVFAIDYVIDGDFAKAANPTNFPTAWCYHDSYTGYCPSAPAEVVTVDGAKALHFYGSAAADGCVIKPKLKFAARAGDLVTISFEAKGTGNGWVTMNCYYGSKWNSWNGALPTKAFGYTEGWKRHTFTLAIKDPNGNETSAVEAAIGIKPGADVYIRGVKLTQTLEVKDYIEMDDFETSKTRTGSPSIVSDYVAPGLLQETKMGTYTQNSKYTSKTIASSTISAPAAGGHEFKQVSYRIYSLSGNATLTEKIGSYTFVLTGGVSIASSRLPADVSFSFNRTGTYEFKVKSLADSSITEYSGSNSVLTSGSSFSRSLKLKGGSVTLDNLAVATAEVDRQKEIAYPWTATPAETFDPVSAGWPIVFNDEFDGSALDETKWYMSGKNDYKHIKVEDGRLVISADYANANSNTVETASIYTYRHFLYGYFEARLKFTYKPGWWSAFWLCSPANGLNPFLDGFEIDCYEDYYTRPDEPGGVAKNVNDHNLHVRGNGLLKSWNYNSVISGYAGLGDAEPYHRIAVKWTPFEITYYMDGNVIHTSGAVSHSPYSTVTFDAFRHAADIAPISAILSGVSTANKTSGKKDMTGFDYPENLYVDYVRIYSCPSAAETVAPSVTIERTDANTVISPGSTLEFSVASAAKSGSIRAVHLFDDGFYMGTVSNSTAVFSVPLTLEHFGKTAWMAPGRQGDIPLTLNGSYHVFAAFAEDTAGNVGHSGTIEVFVNGSTAASTPYGGVAKDVPGVVPTTEYDEGGEGVAYHDSSAGNEYGASTNWRMDEDVDCSQTTIGGVTVGEWINYTVNATKTGRYRLELEYGNMCVYDDNAVRVFLDGVGVGSIMVNKVNTETRDWSIRFTGACEFEMTEGVHVIRFFFNGAVNTRNMFFNLVQTPWFDEHADSVGTTGAWSVVPNSQGGRLRLAAVGHEFTPAKSEPNGVISTIEVPMTFDVVSRNIDALSSRFEGCRAGVLLMEDGLKCLTAGGWVAASGAGRGVAEGDFVELRVVFDDRTSPGRVEYWMVSDGAWRKVAEGSACGSAHRVEVVELNGPSLLNSLRGDYRIEDIRHAAAILLK